MNIETRMEKDVLILELEGDLMAGHESEQLRQVVDQSLKDEKVNVVADMSKVTWMNSSGLGMLISALTSLRGSGGDLRLANLSEKIKRPIKITKLDKVFLDFESVDQAVDSYSE